MIGGLVETGEGMQVRDTTVTLGFWAAFLSPCAMAQQVADGPGLEARPTYGTFDLRSGFAPDPQIIQLHAGGPIDAAKLGPECAGKIAAAPDLRLRYSASNFPLRITAIGSNLVIVVHQPNDAWKCAAPAEDGSAQTQVSWPTPSSGQYDIWVGTRSGSTKTPVRLELSEQPTR